ncbi:MAG: response regulator, partial [Pseudomonas sp.]
LEVRQRALEPFFTTKPLGQGTGLGLSMVYGFARQSGGQLSIDSVAGQGTSVHLYFPADESASAGAQHQPAATPSPPSQRQAHRIMLVEDQPALRLVLGEVLTELGHEVQAFECGRPALEALRAGPLPDLLITDIGLPGEVGGYQLAHAYQGLATQGPVLLITGYDIADALASLQPDGPIELLSKPFDLQTLGERIARLLGATP